MAPSSHDADVPCRCAVVCPSLPWFWSIPAIVFGIVAALVVILIAVPGAAAPVGAGVAAVVAAPRQWPDADGDSRMIDSRNR